MCSSPSLLWGRVHARGPDERIERSAGYRPRRNTSNAITPASRFCMLLSRPRGFCAAGTKIRSDGSPLISHHRAETSTGLLQAEPACVRSNTCATFHPLRALNWMRDRWRSATDSITICGCSTSVEHARATAIPLESLLHRRVEAAPCRVGGDGRADVGMEHRRGPAPRSSSPPGR